MLTDAVVKHANADGKAKKLFDFDGLFLLLMPTKKAPRASVGVISSLTVKKKN